MLEDTVDNSTPGKMKPELLSRFGHPKPKPVEGQSEDHSPLLTRRMLLSAAIAGITALALRKITSHATPSSSETPASLEQIRQEKEDLVQALALLLNQLKLANDSEFMAELKTILEDSNYQASKSNGKLEYLRRSPQPQFYRDNPNWKNMSNYDIVDIRVFLESNTGDKVPNSVKTPNLNLGMFLVKGTNRISDWRVELFVDNNGKIRRDDLTSSRAHGWRPLMNEIELGAIEALVFNHPTGAAVGKDASGYLDFRAEGSIDSPNDYSYYLGDTSGGLQYSYNKK